ncbi:MAG: acetate--CoA ligase [Sandaracinus sp.]|nr:acetate--CoA ligase [Sandaracinus sp.]MCB9631127.1 acetate--CoA ligase [Sandaracinus sp.]
MAHQVPARVREGAATPITDLDRYRETYFRAQTDPNAFWLGVTKERLTWRKEPSLGLEGGYHEIHDGPISWFADGELNVTETCLDRHLATRGDKVAILWEGDEPGDVRKLTYRELHAEVCKTANALAKLGLQKGERAILYMGMVPEAAIAMLACARLGAIHSVVFGGFSADALRDRIRDCGAEIVITQDVGLRGGKHVPLKATTDEALAGAPSVKHVLVYQRTDVDVPWTEGRDVWWHDAVGAASPEHDAVVVEAEHPLFILYTSGSTGRPKGVVHTSGGYLTYASYTHGTVFDLREDDVYACVADVGWITGHSYIVYGPLANGATTTMFESVPTYPDAGRYWDFVARHGVTIFYTAPTALRALAAMGDEHVTKYDRSSLRVLGTVGEPINPEAWQWYCDVVGEKRCNVVDTWWQTETGGIAISPIAPATPTKPGSATLPMPGILPSLRTPEGRVLRGPAEGLLCLDHPWPGQARTVWGDHERFVATYFATVPGVYFTGDGCRRDEDGYYWITGRVDDVLNVAGHRMGTAEFESALVAVESVAEAAVVGYPHPIKGQGVYAYVVAQGGAEVDFVELNKSCREQIGAHAKVDRFQLVPGLPKTRSGKVMRRILRKIAEGRGDELGDTSTLADPSVVDAIRDGYRPE